MARMETRSKRGKGSRKTNVSLKEPLTEPENCIICLEEVSCRGKLSVCEHWFCFCCILEWSKNTNTCPVCKKKFRCISKTHLNSGKSPVQKVRVPDVDQRVWNDDYEIPTDELSLSSDSFENSSSFFDYDDDDEDDDDDDEDDDDDDDDDDGDDDDDSYWGYTSESSWLDITSDEDEFRCEPYAMNGYKLDDSFIVHDLDLDSSYSPDPTLEESPPISPAAVNLSRGKKPRKVTIRQFSSSTKKGKQKKRPSEASPSTRKSTQTASTQASTSGQWLNAANGRPTSSRTKTKPARAKPQEKQNPRGTGRTRVNEPATTAGCSTSTRQSRSNPSDQRVINSDERKHSSKILPKTRRQRAAVGTFDSDSEPDDERLMPSKTQKGRKRKFLQSPEQSSATRKLTRPKRTRPVLREKQNTLK